MAQQTIDETLRLYDPVDGKLLNLSSRTSPGSVDTSMLRKCGQ